MYAGILISCNDVCVHLLAVGEYAQVTPITVCTQGQAPPPVPRNAKPSSDIRRTELPKSVSRFIGIHCDSSSCRSSGSSCCVVVVVVVVMVWP